MKVIEFLAGQLDRELMEHEVQVQFEQHVDFWTLCLCAKELLIEEGSNDTHKRE